MPVSSALLDLAEQFRIVAREELLPRHGKLRADQVHQHSDGSLFTEADLAAEEQLINRARLIYPDAILTGEEAISENPDNFLRTARRNEVVIFDPIDGTGAFKRGEDSYGMMAAIVRHGVTTGAVIYTPGHAVADENGALQPERDLMILAEKGQGCFVNGQRVTLAGRPHSLTEGARAAFACRNQDKSFEATLAEGVPGYRPRNNSSDDYSKILTGAMDATFYSEGFMPGTGLGKCPPWDHAAGVLAVQEAGGYAALPYGGADGQPYTPLVCHDRLLVCSGVDLFRDMVRHLQARTPHFTASRL